MGLQDYVKEEMIGELPNAAPCHWMTGEYKLDWRTHPYELGCAAGRE